MAINISRASWDASENDNSDSAHAMPANSPAEGPPGTSSPVAPVPNAPATANYMTPDQASQSTSQQTPESSGAFTPEPTNESPRPQTTDPRPRPTYEWPGAAPLWRPEHHNYKDHVEGEPEPPEPENTLIAPILQDDDLFLLDFFRKAEE